MFRKNYPDLDLLESPLISANPFGTMLGGIPGSAIAEKIFNDPESWHDSDEENNPDSEITKDPMAWLAEELEKFQGDDESNTQAILRPFSGRYKVMPKLSLALPDANEAHTNWEGVQQGDSQSYLPIFEISNQNSNLDLNTRLSNLWQAGGNIFRSFPSPVAFSPTLPPSPSLIEPNIIKDSIKRPGVSYLNLEAILEKDSSPVVSPIAITSTSTTWSILELYGAPPTPRLDSGYSAAFESYPPTPVPPVPRIPAYIHNPPTSLGIVHSSEPPVKENPSHEMTPIRRLPVIPDLACVSTLPKPPSHAKITPGAPVRGPSLPLPTLPPSHQDPIFSPSITHPSHPNRALSASRSPPAGPRARSDTPPKTRRSLDTGCERSFTISSSSSSSRHHQNRSLTVLPPVRYISV